MLSPEGEKTLYYYIKTRIEHGQKVTAAWAMGLAAILAKKDGIEFKTQHGGPSFGWWMRFKTRHPELGLLNSPDKEREVGQSASTSGVQGATTAATTAQSTVIQSAPNMTSTSGKMDILREAAGTLNLGEKQSYLEKQLNMEAQDNVQKQMAMNREASVYEQAQIQGERSLESQSSLESHESTERRESDGLDFRGQIYF